MSQLSTLPDLTDFEISTPGYIRKIDKRSHWNPSDNENNLEEEAKAAAEKIFKNPEHIYSLWLVSTSEEFYGVIAVLSAGRTKENQNVDFIWIDKKELHSTSLEPNLVPEGECLLVQDLHFNVRIEPDAATKLCFLMKKKSAM